MKKRKTKKQNKKKAKKEKTENKKAEKNKKEMEKLKPKIIRILKSHRIKKAGIFGSYARGDQKKKSDIDILIQPTKGMGLEFIGLQLELEKKLGKKVDLVTYKAIHPLLKNQILKEEVRII